MKFRWIAAALALTACNAPAQPSAPPAPEETPVAAQDADDPAMNSLTGWLAADGPGESAAVWRETADSVDFSLTCSMANKDLSVLAPKPGEKIENGAAASLFLGADEFKSTVTVIDDNRQILLKTPVTPALLKSLSAAKSARLVVGDAFSATGVDDKNTLSDLAVSCGAITNTPAQ